jgi:hypothetical protein
MPINSIAEKAIVRPSVTTWTRLEPRPRDASMERSLQAQIRDPLWMLARQWQVGEFQGADAGSPVQATIAGNTQTISTYRPGQNSSSTIALNLALPLEIHVEREAVSLKLRGSVQLGFYFESQVRQGSVANPDTVMAAFRTSFPVSSVVPDPTYAPEDAIRFRALMAGRVTDGEALYVSAAAVAAGKAPPIPLPAAASDPGMALVLSNFVQHRASLFTEPNADSAWQDTSLDYDFTIGSFASSPGEKLLLNAPSFPGGHLDWYSFALETADQKPPAASNPATVTPFSFTFLPNHVTFRGAHDPRWWMFEDSVTDFGQLDAEHVDLAKLLVMEFALTYGNDWFSVPVPAPPGVLSRVTTLVVTDTFGMRTLIRPSEDTTVNAGETPWSMFKLSGNGVRSDFIVLASTLGVVEEADPIEEVLFLRDDMAAMAWAVEHQLQGDLDAPVDGHEAYLRWLELNPPPDPPARRPGGPQIYYTVEIPVPNNWIPMVPVQTPQGALYLRRGQMEIPTKAGPYLVTARAELLDPGKPFFLADHIVTRSGILANRYFRRARAADGSTYVWLARKSGPGTGLGWSGLRFDTIRANAGNAGT